MGWRDRRLSVNVSVDPRRGPASDSSRHRPKIAAVMRTGSMKQTDIVKSKILGLSSYVMPVALAGFAICAQTAAAQSAAAAGNVPKMEDVYKNIQVLNGMPADQMLTTMRFIRGSLGVACTWCHVEPGEGEPKPEATAAKNQAARVHPGWWADEPAREIDT